MLKPALLLSVFAIASNCIMAQPIADCKNPEGFALYHHNKDAAAKIDFEKDKITGGMLSIHKIKDGTYDLLVVDSRKKITSMVQDGGKFLLLRKGKTDATFLLMFPNSSIELYTLWTDARGRHKLDMLQSRGGDETNLFSHKSSVMVGNCDSINFSLIGN
jgi:hypothetical protein